MGGERYELGIRDQASGQMLLRGPWTAAEIEKALPWLKRMNARGHHVYLRPAGDHALTLIDDLKAEQIERLKGLGLEPAVVVETSPGNHQVWLKHDRVLNPAASTHMAKTLAGQIGGDPNSADHRHFGRLAGFTNPKPAYRDAQGRYPYALVLEARGGPYRRAQELGEALERAMQERAAQAERERRVQAIEAAPALPENAFSRPQGGRGVWDAAGEYRRRAKGVVQWVKSQGLVLDWSRVDFRVAKDLLKAGWKAEQVKAAMLEASPEVDARKAGHVEDYVNRTVQKAWQEPEVQQHLAQRRQRGPEQEPGPERGGPERGR